MIATRVWAFVLVGAATRRLNVCIWRDRLRSRNHHVTGPQMSCQNAQHQSLLLTAPTYHSGLQLSQWAPPPSRTALGTRKGAPRWEFAGHAGGISRCTLGATYGDRGINESARVGAWFHDSVVWTNNRCQLLYLIITDFLANTKGPLSASGLMPASWINTWIAPSIAVPTPVTCTSIETSELGGRGGGKK